MRVDRKNNAHFWLDWHIRGLSMMHADFTSQEYAPHRHEAFVIAVTEFGGAVIRSRGITGQADASALFIFNPDEPQSSWMGESRALALSLFLSRTAGHR